MLSPDNPESPEASSPEEQSRGFPASCRLDYCLADDPSFPPSLLFLAIEDGVPSDLWCDM